MEERTYSDVRISITGIPASTATRTGCRAGDFKAKCLQLLDDVAEHREPLVITKRGKPVARLIPMPPETQLFGALAGSVVDEIDIVGPVDAEWNSAR